MADVAAGQTNDRGARVLVIQDEASQRSRVAGALRGAGFEVVEAATGIAGIEAATACQPDLLLVDLHLPDLDGSEVASKLRRLGLEGLPIVAMGQPGNERGMALSAGCSGTIASPPDLALLPDQVREFLAGKRDKLRGGDEKRYLKVLNQSLVEKLETKVRELTAANERMQRADQFKTEFVQSISHELASPLTPLAGYLKILHGEKLGPLNEKQKKVVESMLQSAERLERTIDNLADFAVLEAGTYHIRAEPIDVVRLAERLVEELRLSQAKAKRVHLELASPPSVVISVDPTRLAQALGNLLEHAVKATPHGGEVLLEVRSTETKVAFDIYDQGDGISPGDQDRIFEPFYRTKGPKPVFGVSLGLPVAKKIAEAHGGGVFMESPPKTQPESEHHFTGSKFSLEIPAVRPA